MEFTKPTHHLPYMPLRDYLPPSCTDHAGRFDTKMAIYSAIGTDVLSQAFSHYFAQYYESHEDWQRQRAMHILDKSLANPQPSRFGRMWSKEEARPYIDFATACVRAWRLEEDGVWTLKEEDEAVLTSPSSEDGPSREQLEAMVADLRRVGQQARAAAASSA